MEHSVLVLVSSMGINFCSSILLYLAYGESLALFIYKERAYIGTIKIFYFIYLESVMYFLLFWESTKSIVKTTESKEMSKIYIHITKT